MFALYKKELHSYFFSPLAYVICALFMLIFSMTFIIDMSDLTSPIYSFSFPEVLYKNYFFFIFLIPALTMRTFAEERKLGTETLIMSSPISIPQIVLAKFLAVSTIFLLMITLSFIYPIITVILGQAYLSSLICSYIGFFAMGLFFIAVGMLMSAFTDSTIIAAILGEGAMFLLFIVDQISQSGLVQSIPALNSAFFAFSTQARFVQFSLGIFSLSDLIFYITSIAVVLSWIIIYINKRRWSRG